jgi:hypothetical protein
MTDDKEPSNQSEISSNDIVGLLLEVPDVSPVMHSRLTKDQIEAYISYYENPLIFKAQGVRPDGTLYIGSVNYAVVFQYPGISGERCVYLDSPEKAVVSRVPSESLIQGKHRHESGLEASFTCLGRLKELTEIKVSGDWDVLGILAKLRNRLVEVEA